MTDLEDDFGGPDLDAPPAPGGVVIPFPHMRANAKVGELWAGELERINGRLERGYRFPSPLDAAKDLARKRKLPTFPWPAQWPELGKRCRLYVGECAGIVGPTGGGKTSFAIQMARAAAVDGIPVLWNPLELDAAELDLRLIANASAIHTARVRDEWTDDQIAHALAAFDDLWRYVPRERTVDLQIEAYRVAIRLAKAIYRRPPFLVIDYIGKLARGARDPRLAIADASEEIRAMAVEEEAFVAILAQPSRSNNAVLTGKHEIESATDTIGAAGESSEIEHACSVMLTLNVFKVDDAQELDAHVHVAKARATGREGREGFRFSKPGGVWGELDYLPATPSEIAADVKKAKKDKSRTSEPTKATSRAELNVARAADAGAERRARILVALRTAGAIGLGTKELRKFPGTGRTQRMQESLQTLEREGAIEKTTQGKWRIINRA